MDQKIPLEELKKLAKAPGELTPQQVIQVLLEHVLDLEAENAVLRGLLEDVPVGELPGEEMSSVDALAQARKSNA